MSKGSIKAIGGIFFKCEDPTAVKNWYKETLGLKTTDYGAMFESRRSTSPDEKLYLQWSPFKKDTTYMEPSKKDFMINMIVDDMEAVLEKLSQKGIEAIHREEMEYGKFAHIMDPEGNKIELWEPAGEGEFAENEINRS